MAPGRKAVRADISGILNDWPYEPGKLNVRLVEGDDGNTYVQVRVDVGILQMHASGRPDGQRPEGYESLLEQLEAEHDDADADEAPFTLSTEQCQALREEAAQYHQRYMAMLALDRYDEVVRDTTRNLRVLDFCNKHAERDADREMLEQFRPYITMMRARAMASLALNDNEAKAAVLAIDSGLDALRLHYDEHGQSQLYDDSSEVRMLRGMRDALVPKLPVSQKSELKKRLQAALEQENYELAAILRDELRMLAE
jgi:hypothetical protein